MPQKSKLTVRDSILLPLHDIYYTATGTEKYMYCQAIAHTLLKKRLLFSSFTIPQYPHSCLYF